jgi:hypothetical protein
MKRRLFALLAAAFATLSSFALQSRAADLALQCDPPKGQRVSLGNLFTLDGKTIQSTADGIRWESDSYSNVRPIFIWRERRPGVLLYAWGNTIPDALLGHVKNQTKFVEAVVIYRDTRQIQAVDKRCGTVSCTTTLLTVFPSLSFMTAVDSYFTNAPRLIEQAVTRVFAARCNPLK